MTHLQIHLLYQPRLPHLGPAPCQEGGGEGGREGGGEGGREGGGKGGREEVEEGRARVRNQVDAIGGRRRELFLVDGGERGEKGIQPLHL